MKSIDYYFSVLSPFTYLADNRLEAMADRNSIAINYRPMDIMAVFSRTGGVAPKDRHQSRKSYRLQDLSRTAQVRGLSINLQPAHWPTDPVPASCAIIAAQSELEGDIGKLVRCVLRSCWAEDLDIARSEIVDSCLTESGFGPGLGRNSQHAKSQFQRNTEDAVDANVFGAPSYVVDGQVFWGQDRLDQLEMFLDRRIS